MATVQNRNTVSAKSRVLRFLAEGNTLTARQARSKFRVANLRATMSSIRHQVERYGNWRIVTDTNDRGETVYSMKRVLLVDPQYEYEI